LSKPSDAFEVRDRSSYAARNFETRPVPSASAGSYSAVHSDLVCTAVDSERGGGTGEANAGEYYAGTRGAKSVGVALVNEYTELPKASTRVSRISNVGDGAVRGIGVHLDAKGLVVIDNRVARNDNTRHGHV